MFTPSRNRMATKSRGAGNNSNNVLRHFTGKTNLPQGEVEVYAKLPLTP